LAILTTFVHAGRYCATGETHSKTADATYSAIQIAVLSCYAGVVTGRLVVPTNFSLCNSTRSLHRSTRVASLNKDNMTILVELSPAAYLVIPSGTVAGAGHQPQS